MSSEAELEELLNGSPGLGSDLGLSPTRSASPSAGAESPCRSSISRRSSTSRLSYSASRAAHKRAARSRSRSRSHSSRGGSSQAPSPRYDDDESDGRRADVESPAPRRTEDDSDDDHADGSDQMGGNDDACDDGPPNVDDRDPDPVPVPRRTTVQSNFSWGPLTGVNVSTLPPADKAKRQAQKGGLKIPPGSKPVQFGKQASVSQTEISARLNSDPLLRLRARQASLTSSTKGTAAAGSSGAASSGAGSSGAAAPSTSGSSGAASGKQAREHRFQTGWMDGRSWLAYDEEKKVMTCKRCTDEGKSGPWVKGMSTLRYKAVTDHDADHLASDKKKKQPAEGGGKPKARGIHRDIYVSTCVSEIPVHAQSADQEVIAEGKVDAVGIFYPMWENAFTCAQKNLSNMTYEALCDADRRKDITFSDRYQHHACPKIFQQHISDEILEADVARWKKSPFLGVAVDETTDVSHTKQMIIYIFYVDVERDFRIECDFFCILPVENGKAETIAAALRIKLQRHGLWANFITFGSDGPTVMTGDKGVVGLLKKLKSCLVNEHCIAHRAALASEDSFNDVAFCKKLDELVRGLGRFYSHSTERRKELLALAEEIGDSETQVGMSCATRWLSKDGASDSIVKKYETILQQHYINYDATDTSRGLYTRLTDYNYFAGLCHSADLLNKLALMSKVRACECTASRSNRVLTSHCSLSEIPEEDPRRPHCAPNCRKYQNRTRQVQRGMERAKFIYATDKYRKL